jgi:hypothetical protein
MSLVVKSKTKDLVKCEVIDGGELKSRRHLNVRGKSATLPSITGIILLHLMLIHCKDAIGFSYLLIGTISILMQLVILYYFAMCLTSQRRTGKISSLE